MNRNRFLLVTLLGLLSAIPSFASYTDYTTPGIYSIGTNCGFEILGTTDGWVSFRLTNDGLQSVDLWGIAGSRYPLRLAELTIHSFSPPVRVHTTPSCTCSPSLTCDSADTTCYTRSQNIDEQCETDANRPLLADPMTVTPGPDLANNVGFYSAGSGEIDYLSFDDTDTDFWQTARMFAGDWWPVGIRRCRYVTDSGNSFLTLIAP